MNKELTALIQRQAYLLWKEEGEPLGQDFSHWLKAEAIVLAELSKQEERKQLKSVDKKPVVKKSAVKKKSASKKKSRRT